MKKILSLLLIFAFVLSLAACGAGGNTVTTTDGGNADPSATAYPITVTDQAGRTVTIDSEPRRIVSGYYISTSAIIALGIEERLVGIEAKANKRPIYSLSAPELIELPNVGTAKEFDLEGCVSLEPDLVILPIKLKNAAETLTALGIDVLLVNPEDQQLLEEMVSLIGKATNRQSRASELLSFISQQNQMLSESLAAEDRPKVYLAGNSAMLSTAGNAMYQSDMIRLAGGANVAADITDSYWVEISYEQLLTWDPEYIILASDATYTVEDVLSDPNLSDCDAVKNGRVYKMPAKAEAWDSPVPGGILGAVWLSALLHPETLTQADAEEIIDTYYETFYGFKYSEK